MSSPKSKPPRFRFNERSGKPYILPTWYGSGYLLLIVLVFAIGYYRDNAPYHTVGLTLIVFGLVAMIHTNANIQNLRVSVDHCEPAAAGDSSAVHLILNGQGGAPAHNILLGLEKGFGPGSDFISEVKDEARGAIRVGARKRGLYPIRRVRVQSRSVYSLFRAWCWHDSPGILVVYPRSDGYHPLPPGKDAKSRKDEGLKSRRLDSGDDFQGHKPFVPGISMQHVDWKAYARGQDLLVKDFENEGSEALDLLWEDTRGQTEDRLEQLSSWIAQMNRHQRPYSLSLPNFHLPRGSGSRHDEAALYALAAYEEA